MKTKKIPQSLSIVGNDTYDSDGVYQNIKSLLSGFSLVKKIEPSSRVLIKVNMACSGTRNPDDRYTSHPVVVESVIRYFQEKGAEVAFGDDVARAGKFCESIWKSTKMLEVSHKTGASLIDFVVPRAREVKGTLLYPKSYLITNAYFEYDYVINLANCRSHSGVIMSGAIKNMFGFVVGTRKYLFHRIFRGNYKSFSKALANIHSRIPAHLSILDLTTVVEGDGLTQKVVGVGYIMASENPVLLDSLASWIIGYDKEKIWTTYYGEKFGLGSGSRENIKTLRHSLSHMKRKKLQLPLEAPSEGFLKRTFYTFSALFFNPHAKINPDNCKKCGSCVSRCPVNAIEYSAEGKPVIDKRKCSLCMCCLRVCENDAAVLEYPLAVKILRKITGRPILLEVGQSRRSQFKSRVI